MSNWEKMDHGNMRSRKGKPIIILFGMLFHRICDIVLYSSLRIDRFIIIIIIPMEREEIL